MNQLCLLTILALLFSCSCKEEMVKDYIREKVVIKKGEKLIQGQEYEIIFTLNAELNEQINAEIYYQKYLDKEAYSESIIKLQKIDNFHYKGKFRILPNTSWISLSFHQPRQLLISESSTKILLPVYKNNDKLEYGAREVLLQNSNIENYKKIFFEELNENPNNTAIYANRWLYELERRILNKDTVKSQIKFLESNKIKNEILPLLQIIAYTITNDYVKLNEVIDNVDQVKNSIYLNNWDLGGLLTNILYDDDSENRKQKFLVLEKLVRNNPISFFTRTQINAGIIKQINPFIAIEVLNKVISNYPEIYYFNITKGLILSRFFLPDSLKAAKEIEKFLIDIIKEYMNNNNIYYSGHDPHHALFLGRGLISSISYEISKSTKDYIKTIEYLKFTLGYYEPTSNNTAMTYDMLSELYQSSHQSDSAIKYLYYAYSLYPGKPGLKDRVISLINNKTNQTKIKNIMDAKRKFDFPVSYLNKEVPEIKYVDNTSENLLKIKTPKIIIFFTLNCSSCRDLILDIAKYISEQDSKKVFVALIAPENVTNLKKCGYYNYLNSKIITNSQELMRYFGLGNFAPQFVIISSDNRVISKNDGFNKNYEWGKLLY